MGEKEKYFKILQKNAKQQKSIPYQALCLEFCLPDNLKTFTHLKDCLFKPHPKTNKKQRRETRLKWIRLQNSPAPKAQGTLLKRRG